MRHLCARARDMYVLCCVYEKGGRFTRKGYLCPGVCASKWRRVRVHLEAIAAGYGRLSLSRLSGRAWACGCVRVCVSECELAKLSGLTHSPACALCGGGRARACMQAKLDALLQVPVCVRLSPLAVAGRPLNDKRGTGTVPAARRAARSLSSLSLILSLSLSHSYHFSLPHFLPLSFFSLFSFLRLQYRRGPQ